MPILSLRPSPLPAATVTEAWVQRYGPITERADDQASKVVVDANGDIIVTGTSNNDRTGADIVTIKYSGAGGSVLWQQRHNGPANRDDRPAALAVVGNGNVVVVGTTYNSADGPGIYTAKYAAADGALQWERRYANGRAAQAGAFDRNGDVVVAGDYVAKYAAAEGMRSGQGTPPASWREFLPETDPFG